MLLDPIGTVTHAWREFGDVVGLRFGPPPFRLYGTLVVVPEHLAHVLQENQQNYVKAVTYEPLRYFLGDGLLTSEGDRWRRDRRLAQPLFHRSATAALAPVMVAAAARLAEDLGAEADRGTTTDLAGYFTRATLEIAAECFFGAGVDEGVGDIGAAMDTLLRFAIFMVPFPTWLAELPVGPARRARAAMATLDALCYGLIAKARAREDPADDLLSRLLAARGEDGEAMSDQAVRDHALTFLLAGHETTAGALAWTIALLAENPDARAAVEEEVDRVVGGRLPGVEHLPDLPYTRAVIAESLRLYPPAWIIERNALGDDQVGAWSIPAGSVVMIPIWLLHRHPDLWPDPARFDPGRFLGEDLPGGHRFAYLPFGGGGRVCIGAEFARTELALVLAALLGRFRFELVDGFPEAEPLITLRPKGGMRVRVHRR